MATFETSWLFGLLGGLMIGLAATLLLLGNGRIMGVSGLFAGLFSRSPDPARAERVAFIGGLLLAPALMTLAGAGSPTNATSNWWVLIAGGLLVGFGTRLGGGCTSGHGVCGMSRFSARSIVATLVFMAAGIFVVTAIRQFLGAL